MERYEDQLLPEKVLSPTRYLPATISPRMVASKKLDDLMKFIIFYNFVNSQTEKPFPFRFCSLCIRRPLMVESTLLSVPSGCHACLMRVEEIVVGVLALAWGGILWVMRPELLKLGREGGRGFRDPKVINILVIAAGISLPLGGLYLIICRGF